MIAIIVHVALTLCPSPLRSQEEIDAAREYNVKAVYLYSFGRYITWSDSSFQRTAGDFVIGMLGDSSISSPLQRIARKKTIGGRRIVVRRFDSVENIGPCQILFAARNPSFRSANAIAERIIGKEILLVGEQSGFASQDGMIEFFTDGLTVRFRINAANIRAQKLGIDAKLLRLGQPVTEQR